MSGHFTKLENIFIFYLLSFSVKFKLWVCGSVFVTVTVKILILPWV